TGLAWALRWLMFIALLFETFLMRIVLVAAMAALIASVAGCDRVAQQTSAAASEKTGAVPLAMLPRTIAPTHYQLAFTVDPAGNRFSGHAEIEVKILKSQSSYFLHGLDLQVTGALARLPS